MKNERVVHVVSMDTQVLNNTIVAYINQVQSCTFAQLAARFAPELQPGAQEPFRRRMQYLVYARRVDGEGSGLARVFTPADNYAAPASKPPQANPVESAESAPVVPPPRMNVMHGLVYVPERTHVARPGGTDFLRIKSLGVQC